jgi:peptidoglycan/xylan/chitin deacetylase (PgdA/CDA1 family)
MLTVEARKLAAAAYSQLQLSRLTTRYAKRTLVALNYHYFTTGASTSYLEINRDIAERQLCTLRQHSLIRPAKLALDSVFRGGETVDRPEVLVSIDDGCASFEIILPLIEKLDIPVTLFIPIGLCLDSDSLDGIRSRCLRLYKEIDHSQCRPNIPTDAEEVFQMILAADASQLRLLEERFQKLPRNPDPISVRRLYSMAELKALTTHPLITLAPHSMSHQALGQLPSSWLEWEITTSCAYIAAIGGDPELFAYPYGDARSVDDRCARALSNSGSRFAFTTLCYRISSTCNTFLLGRAPLFNCEGERYICGTALGGLEWYDIIRHGKKLYETYTHSLEQS